MAMSSSLRSLVEHVFFSSSLMFQISSFWAYRGDPAAEGPALPKAGNPPGGGAPTLSRCISKDILLWPGSQSPREHRGRWGATAGRGEGRGPGARAPGKTNPRRHRQELEAQAYQPNSRQLGEAGGAVVWSESRGGEAQTPRSPQCVSYSVSCRTGFKLF